MDNKKSTLLARLGTLALVAGVAPAPALAAPVGKQFDKAQDLAHVVQLMDDAGKEDQLAWRNQVWQNQIIKPRPGVPPADGVVETFDNLV